MILVLFCCQKSIYFFDTAVKKTFSDMLNIKNLSFTMFLKALNTPSVQNETKITVTYFTKKILLGIQYYPLCLLILKIFN